MAKFFYSNFQSTSREKMHMHPNQYFQSLSDNETAHSVTTGTDSVSTMSTYTSFYTIPNFDNTEWEVRQPESIHKITRYTLKRTVLAYGIRDDITKNELLQIFSQFGPVSDIVSVNDDHYILGTPDVDHARRLTQKYIPTADPDKSTCFYVIFQTKGGFVKCAHKSLHNPYFNIFKMDKRLKDFNLKRMS